MKTEGAHTVKERFQGFFVPERKEQPEGKKFEKIIVVSDLHGSKPEVIARLRAIPLEGEQKPTAVVLGGDVVGTPDLEDLQRLFYNGVINHARAALASKPDLPEDELLSYSGNNPPSEGFTLRKGFEALRRKEMELEGLFDEGLSDDKAQRRDELIGQMADDAYVAREIKRYTAEYVHFGHYASNLNPDAVQKLADGLKENAEKLAEPLLALQENGITVVITEGNWDPSPPIAFKPGTKDAQRLSPDEQQERTGFSTQKFFEEKGIEYTNRMYLLETETATFVLIPFDQLVKYSEMSPDDIKSQEAGNLAIVSDAHKNGKQVIVVQHGEVMWEPHNLTAPQSKPKGEHEKIIAGSNTINQLLQPDEVLHGHFHDPFVTEDGEKLPIDTKYAVVFDSSPIVIDPKDHAPGQSVVSYMPLQKFATIHIPIENENNERKIEGFGGSREPAMVE